MGFSVSGRSASDLLGMANSVLCLAHCLAMPLLVAIGGAVPHHPIVSIGFIAVAGWAVWSATRGAGTYRGNRFLWMAWALFAVTLLLEDLHPAFALVSLAASIGLVIGHAWRWWRPVRA